MPTPEQLKESRDREQVDMLRRCLRPTTIPGGTAEIHLVTREELILREINEKLDRLILEQRMVEAPGNLGRGLLL